MVLRCLTFHNAESLLSGVGVLAESIHFYMIDLPSFIQLLEILGRTELQTSLTLYFYAPSVGYNEPSYLGCTLVTNFTHHVLL